MPHTWRKGNAYPFRFGSGLTRWEPANLGRGGVCTMIRLLVSTEEETVWREISPRLRGPTITTSSDSAWDAAVFAGPGRPEPGVIERCLRAGKHVLMAFDACPSCDSLEALVGA